MKYIEKLETFTVDNLPDLDTCVLGALELLSTTTLPTLTTRFKRPLVVGSGNALVTGMILFKDTDAVFADESTYKERLEVVSAIDGAVLISASGGKHAVPIAKELSQRGIETELLTNNLNAPAKQYIKGEGIYVFPKNREPYTYNTSTYLGMILGKTKESAEKILTFIEQDVAPLLPSNLRDYKTFFFIIPAPFDELREMFLKKFRELFGGNISGRVFTAEQIKHGETVVQSKSELFINFDGSQDIVGEKYGREISISLPKNADFGTMMAVGYYIIGNIQKQHPPYFRDNIEGYVRRSSRFFGEVIESVVE